MAMAGGRAGGQGQGLSNKKVKLKGADKEQEDFEALVTHYQVEVFRFNAFSSYSRAPG